MPVQLTYPGVYIEELPSGVHTITGVATSIAAFVGGAEQGPVSQPGHIYSFADFQRLYGGLNAKHLLGYSVKHFFDNGGSEAYVVRMLAPPAARKARRARPPWTPSWSTPTVPERGPSSTA
jgi:phage tail sheath protein FI